MGIPTHVLLNPYVHGYVMCDHCNGYGSSLKDPVGQDVCSNCGGYGIVKKEKGNDNDKFTSRR